MKSVSRPPCSYLYEVQHVYNTHLLSISIPTITLPSIRKLCDAYILGNIACSIQYLRSDQCCIIRPLTQCTQWASLSIHLHKTVSLNWRRTVIKPIFAQAYVHGWCQIWNSDLSHLIAGLSISWVMYISNCRMSPNQTQYKWNQSVYLNVSMKKRDQSRPWCICTIAWHIAMLYMIKWYNF